MPMRMITSDLSRQNNPLYTAPPTGKIQAAVWDLTSTTLPPDLEPESVDIIVLIFVLSALHPNEWRNAVSNVHKVIVLSSTSQRS